MKKATSVAKPLLKSGLIAAAFVGSVLVACEPAAADRWGISISSNAVGFSYNSGGYCDDYGCPGNYWDDPVYYCPVYFRHRWYRGPVYYSRRGGETLYWIHDGWRRDEWGGPRPPWACNDRYGPALDLYFYQSNGFRVRNSWWNSWGREHNDWYWRDHPDWNRNQGVHVTIGQEWNRDRGWNGASHAWGHAGGQGFDQGRGGGAMGAGSSQNTGGNQGGDQGTSHHRTGGSGFQDQSGGQQPDLGHQHGDRSNGSNGVNPSSNSNGGQGTGQGHSQHDNTGTMQNPPPPQTGGQGSDQGGRHHDKAAGGTTGDQGNSGNGAGGSPPSGGGSNGQGKGQSQGGPAPDNSGNGKSDNQGHGDHHSDQGASPDSGNGKHRDNGSGGDNGNGH